jgi:hypothetical protein
MCQGIHEYVGDPIIFYLCYFSQCDYNVCNNGEKRGSEKIYSIVMDVIYKHMKLGQMTSVEFYNYS